MKRPFKDLSDTKLKEEYHFLNEVVNELQTFGTRDALKLMYLEAEIVERGWKIKKNICSKK